MVLKYKNNSINKISSRKFTSPGEHYLAKSTFSKIMPNTRRHSYDLNFKLKIVIEAEAVNNNREIAREYGIFELMVSNQYLFLGCAMLLLLRILS